jgi:hypothetical protein
MQLRGFEASINIPVDAFGAVAKPGALCTVVYGPLLSPHFQRHIIRWK